MPVKIVVAAAAFLLSLGLALWLARSRRERLAFAAIVAAPLVAALAFAAVAALQPAETGDAARADPHADAHAPTGSSAAAGASDTLRRNAQELYRAKRYAEARDAYARLVAAEPGDVEAWADFADASAGAAGGDLKAGSSAIDRALAIDPNHLKALWLKASLELQEKRYTSSAQVWERLLTLLPPGSGEAEAVRANLEEARTLAKSQAAAR
jgi:cytochrome c-type biogenesis protein CcmH